MAIKRVRIVSLWIIAGIDLGNTPLRPYIYHLPLVIAPISSNRLLTKRVASAHIVDFMVAAVYSLLDCCGSSR
jgi:hypothetical protein